MIIPDLIHDAATRFGPRAAVQAGDRSITYAELYSQAMKVGGGLTRQGVAPKQHVLLMGHNGPDLMVGLFGIIMTGAVPVFVPPDAGNTELEGLMQTLKPTTILCTTKCAVRARDLPLRLLTLPVEGEPLGEFCSVDPEETALIRLTSGSTGVPKAIELSHRACLWRPLTGHYAAGGRHLWPLPARLTFEKVFPVIRSGGTMIYTHSIEPAEVVKTLAEARVTYLWAVPAVLHLLIEYVRTHGAPSLPDLWGASTGAATLDKILHREFEEAFGIPLHQHYGMSEGDVCTQNPVGSIRYGSVGCPLPGAEVLVVDTDLHPLSPGVEGEVIYRSAGVMNGYFGRPDLTA